jgi:serine/threonine protein kinase
MLKQIAEGIKMLNEEGFLHCDLKPENILVEGSE